MRIPFILKVTGGGGGSGGGSNFNLSPLGITISSNNSLVSIPSDFPVSDLVFSFINGLLDSQYSVDSFSNSIQFNLPLFIGDSLDLYFKTTQSDNIFTNFPVEITQEVQEYQIPSNFDVDKIVFVSINGVEQRDIIDYTVDSVNNIINFNFSLLNGDFLDIYFRI